MPLPTKICVEIGVSPAQSRVVDLETREIVHGVIRVEAHLSATETKFDIVLKPEAGALEGTPRYHMAIEDLERVAANMGFILTPKAG